MNIVFAASEAVPFCKTGGLADVMGALPAALASLQHHVSVFLPYYRIIKDQKFKIKPTQVKFSVTLNGLHETVTLLEAVHRFNHRVYFVDCPKYFDRPGLYGEVPGTDFPDNAFRFGLFCRSVLEGLKELEIKPDVIHGHDWQSGLIPAYLKSVYASDPFFRHTATVFSIHNMAYQGVFNKNLLEPLGLPWSMFHSNGLEFYDQINFLKAGLAYSDALSTVSETYAKEIISSNEFGYGLEGLLKTRQARLKGIRNGLDVVVWNPAKDKFLLHKFDKTKSQPRREDKAALQKQAGFVQDENVPILGFVGRLDRQKGIDVLLEIAPTLLRQGVQLVFLGVGDPKYQQSLLDLQRKHPIQVFVETRFAEPFAHLIYAGSDLFMMPSLYEPCGLGQMIAMRYGALPVVNPTGGLLDTVKDIDHVKNGTGFVGKTRSSAAFLNAVQRGLSYFKKKKEWLATQKKTMAIDFSWKKSVPAYEKLYEDSLKWHAEKR